MEWAASHDVTEEPDAVRSTSTSLLMRVKAREPQAWNRLVHLYAPLVYGWCRRAQLQDADAEDVSQEVLAAVASNMAEFRRERPGDTFRGWLWTICRRKMVDHWRLRARHGTARGGSEAQQQLAQLPEDDAVSLSSGWFPADEQLRVVRRALELLREEFEERTWQAFWRMAVLGESAAEIAQDLGMTKHTVRQAKYRVMRRLKLELEGLVDVPESRL